MFNPKLNKLDYISPDLSVESPLERAVFEKYLRFAKLAHDFKNMLKAKFQNQGSFRICYHSLTEILITSNLLFVITTFVNTKVR